MNFKNACRCAIQDNSTLHEILKNPQKSQNDLPKVVISDTVAKLLTRLLRAVEIISSELIAPDYQCCISERLSASRVQVSVITNFFIVINIFRLAVNQFLKVFSSKKMYGFPSRIDHPVGEPERLNFYV